MNCVVQAGLMFYPAEKDIKKEVEPLEKIQLEHLIIAYLILGVGCFVSLIVFLFEMYSKKKVQQLQQLNESENQNMEISSIE